MCKHPVLGTAMSYERENGNTKRSPLSDAPSINAHEFPSNSNVVLLPGASVHTIASTQVRGIRRWRCRGYWRCTNPTCWSCPTSGAMIGNLCASNDCACSTAIGHALLNFLAFWGTQKEPFQAKHIDDSQQLDLLNSGILFVFLTGTNRGRCPSA